MLEPCSTTLGWVAAMRLVRCTRCVFVTKLRRFLVVEKSGHLESSSLSLHSATLWWVAGKQCTQCPVPVFCCVTIHLVRSKGLFQRMGVQSTCANLRNGVPVRRHG